MSSFHYPKFLLFGDSITEYGYNQYPLTSRELLSAINSGKLKAGFDPVTEAFQESSKLNFSFSSTITNDYVRKMQIIQRGFAGYTSEQAVKLAPILLRREHDEAPEGEKLELAFIFFGTNDARHKGTQIDNFESVPIDKYLTNMEKTISEFKKRNIDLIIVTPGLHDQQLNNEVYPLDLQTGDYRSNGTNKLYADKLYQLCSGLNIPCIHLYQEMKNWVERDSKCRLVDVEQGGLGILLTDGIHFTGTGYKLLYDCVMRTIKHSYPSLYPDSMENKYPDRSTLTEATEFV